MKSLSSAIIVLAAAVIVAGALQGTTGARDGALMIGYGLGMTGLIGWVVSFNSPPNRSE